MIFKKLAILTTILALMSPNIVYCSEQIPVNPVDIFLSASAFVGNSVGEGLTMYNNAKGKVPLGSATMLTRVSYSFYADERGRSKYIPKLAGVPMRAKDAIKQCGAQYVFICMGTNDLVGNASCEGACQKYQQYIEGILAENPTVTIFIESCTPTRPGSNVSNDKITLFNSYMESYCSLFPNMFYIDISTPLKDESGYLASGYCSDGSCHLTNTAYGIWADTVRTYISAYIAAMNAARAEAAARDRALAKANYEKNMDEMYNKKQKIRDERINEERQAAAALREENSIPFRQDDELLQGLNLQKKQYQHLQVSQTLPSPLLRMQPLDPPYSPQSSRQLQQAFPCIP
ncbi:MAG: hypothetical protein IJ245_01405 [Lachnospiraceae bacterium]|nr:hypothetical protein [Lachnospiraceae bacterium]